MEWLCEWFIFNSIIQILLPEGDSGDWWDVRGEVLSWRSEDVCPGIIFIMSYPALHPTTSEFTISKSKQKNQKIAANS